MCVRAVIVYMGGLAILRFGKNRLFGRSTALDIILGIMLGATLSRSINGGAPLLETLAACVALVILHWGFATLTTYSDRLDRWIKGHQVVLIRDGKIERPNLRKADLSERDLLEALRLGAHDDDIARVRSAYLERNGEISVVLKRPIGAG
jgi:uncharacterized membrane protein YcaP (DUF421 family)